MRKCLFTLFGSIDPYINDLSPVPPEPRPPLCLAHPQDSIVGSQVVRYLPAGFGKKVVGSLPGHGDAESVFGFDEMAMVVVADIDLDPVDGAGFVH